MRYLVALRLFSEHHARFGIEAHLKDYGPRGKLIDINVERFHPALKNIIEHLRSQGKLLALHTGQVLHKINGKKTIDRIDQGRLYWCEIETELASDYWAALNEVEAILPKDDFARFAQTIRCRSGAAYFAGCEEYANQMIVKTPQTISYEPPRKPTDRAA